MHLDTAGFADDAATVYVGGNGDPQELDSGPDKLASRGKLKKSR
jgi:hypothetical protein